MSCYNIAYDLYHMFLFIHFDYFIIILKLLHENAFNFLLLTTQFNEFNEKLTNPIYMTKLPANANKVLNLALHEIIHLITF